MTEGLPFLRYQGGGRKPLGRPRQGDLTARHGYGPPVFDQCGYCCAYCGLDMSASFEAWLQLSIDHVIPRQMSKPPRNWPAYLVEDITNLVTCCRACNDFGNRFVVPDAAPDCEPAFYDLRDRVFVERRYHILLARQRERRDHFEKVAANRHRVTQAGG